MKPVNEFVRNTIIFGVFCILYGIVSILIGMYVFPGTQDQAVYVGAGILLEVFAVWYLYDQLS